VEVQGSADLFERSRRTVCCLDTLRHHEQPFERTELRATSATSRRTAMLWGDVRRLNAERKVAPRFIRALVLA
jgi:hypothetical protein